MLATVLSLAAGAPGGLMHDSMSLGALLVSPLQVLSAMDSSALAQLAAVGATALFTRESLDKRGLSGGSEQNEWIEPQIASETIF